MTNGCSQPKLSRFVQSVAMGSSLAPMEALVQASPTPRNIVQPPLAGPMKWSREPKNAL